MEEPTAQINNEYNSVVWSSEEISYKEKNADWYWGFGLMVLTGSIFCFIFGNWLFGIFLILGGIVVGLFASKKPEIHECKIDEHEIRYGSISITWEDVIEWNTSGQIPHCHLIVKTKIPLKSLLVIPLGRFPEENIINAIKQTEKRNKNLGTPLTHILLDKIGF